MTKSYAQFYQELQEEGYFERMALDPNAQFGSEQEPFLGATILPEVMVEENAYEETQVRYRTKPALDGTRYSPAQMQKSGHLIGSVKVELGNTDTADELTGNEHDGLVKLLNRGGDAQAIAQALRWTDRSLIRPHLIKNEIQRWQALTLNSVERKGSNGYAETVQFYQHPGHRINVPSGTVGAPQGWYNNTYDPFDDIATGVQKLEDLGYSVRGMFCLGKITSVLQRNAEVAKRASQVVINANGDITSSFGRVTMSQLNSISADEEMPMFTKYNGGYETPNGFKRFLDLSNDRDYLVIVGNSDRQWDLATDYTGRLANQSENSFSDAAIQLEGTLGYYAVGRNVGQTSSGRTVTTEVQTRKPVGLYGESYETGFPVILDPQSIVVIEIMRPTA